VGVDANQPRKVSSAKTSAYKTDESLTLLFVLLLLAIWADLI